jgi:ADP-dependent phosphofructokinase/glucokinase
LNSENKDTNTNKQETNKQTYKQTKHSSLHIYEKKNKKKKVHVTLTCLQEEYVRGSLVKRITDQGDNIRNEMSRVVPLSTVHAQHNV